MSFGPNERDYTEVMEVGRYGGTSAVYVHVKGEYGLEARYWFDESESGENYMFCEEVLLPNTDVNEDRYIVSADHMYLPTMVAEALYEANGFLNILDMDADILFQKVADEDGVHITKDTE